MILVSLSARSPQIDDFQLFHRFFFRLVVDLPKHFGQVDVRLELRQVSRLQRRHVHGGHHFAIQCVGDKLRDRGADVVVRFLGGGAEMRRNDDVVELQQGIFIGLFFGRLVVARLGIQHVDTGRGDLAAL